MPPKKKGKGKGKGKDGKEKKKEKEVPEPVLEHVDPNTKQYFLDMIKDLEEKLKRYQKKCDELELLNKKYEGQFESSNNDKRDIVNNLKKEIEKKIDEVADLSDRLVGLQQAKDAEKEAFEKQLADLRTEFQETKEVLSNQNNTLLAKLTALDEFKSQKEELLANLATLQSQIEMLEEDHKNKLNEIEKKVIMDKDRLKKEMIVKVSQVAAEFRRVSNKQMADTTKRTIKENVSINNQLYKMSDKVVELVEDNDELKIKNKVQKQHIDLLEDNEKELAKKNVSNVKLIKLLTEKCRSQEEIIIELEDKLNETKDIQMNQELTIASMEKQLEHLKDCDDKNLILKKEVTHLQTELDSSLKHRYKLEKVLKQASDSLVLALSKKAAARRNKLENEIQDENVEEDWTDLEKRDHMLENLLILLNSAASLGFGPNPEEFASSSYEKTRMKTDYPGSGKGIRKNQIPLSELGKSGYYRPHYELGDLGIVPKQTEHLLTNMEKNKITTTKKEINNVQKVTKRSIATQTIDFTKASLFGVESDLNKSDQLHPIYENRDRKPPNKSQVNLPLTGMNRVTNKVF